MNLQEILSFLEDEEKRNRLIYKLKNEGEDSKPVHAFTEIITFLNLDKTHREIHQKSILQNTFHFCDTNECFDNFRHVCKSWQDAVETIKFNMLVEIDDSILEYEQNDIFQVCMEKYLKMFKNLDINITEQILMKWGSVSKLILQNMKNLHEIRIVSEENTPQNFDAFALELFQKSQSTIEILQFNTHEILHLPIISLPNVTEINLMVKVDHDEQIDQFTDFIQRILENCEYLENFQIYDIVDSPQMTEYIAQNYPGNCLYSEDGNASRELPTKISYCDVLSDLSTFKYPSSIQCLYLNVNSFNRPHEEGWDDYKSILALCSNLQKIYMFENVSNEIELEETLQNISHANQDIWNQRIQYLKSYGTEIINWDQFCRTREELSEQSKWVFSFY